MRAHTYLTLYQCQYFSHNIQVACNVIAYLGVYVFLPRARLHALLKRLHHKHQSNRNFLQVSITAPSSRTSGGCRPVLNQITKCREIKIVLLMKLSIYGREGKSTSSGDTNCPIGGEARGLYGADSDMIMYCNIHGSRGSERIKSP